MPKAIKTIHTVALAAATLATLATSAQAQTVSARHTGRALQTYDAGNRLVRACEYAHPATGNRFWHAVETFELCPSTIEIRG